MRASTDLVFGNAAFRTGLSFGRPGGGPAYDPASLFANGEQGAWYDPSDLSTVFQDAAGTTPVTGAGQPVRRMLDKSGRGNHVTAPNDASRPILRTAGGLWWLEGDGFDDHLSTGLLTLTNELLISCGMKILSGGGIFAGPWRFLRDGGDPTATADNRLEEYRNADLNNRRKAVYRRYTPNAAIYDNAAARPALETTSHVSWFMQRSASARQGVIYAGSTVADTAATRHTIGGSSTLDLFRGYSGAFMKGNFYGGVFLMRDPTDEEIALTNGWMMQKTGATL